MSRDGSRLARCFARLSAEGRKALGVYLTAGDPDLATTRALVLEAARRGADFVELGVPFSDPTADGPTIQRAAERALAAGTTLPAVLDSLRAIRDESDVPVVLFGYYNPFFAFAQEGGRFRPERLARAVKEAGADGILVVDLPVEELHEIKPACDAAGLDTIVLVAPTTPPARLAAAAALGRGFLYYISVTGVTGARDRLSPELAERLAAVRARVSLPVVVGFGISTPAQAAEAARYADGVVVGSALVRLVEAEAAAVRPGGSGAAGAGGAAGDPGSCERLVRAVGDFVAALKGAL
ncbi:MAG TPA: tryptophan synthase subunit alpha [Thermodesulfobacteriota bacterium]|nr:tryptophan synthase subunit alpha [Thermodesulfobacteriota bacterium]